MSTARQAGCAALCAVVLGTAALAASPLDGRWTLTDRRALGGSAGDGGPEVTLEIEGGNVAASAGCNRAAGSIKEQAGRLQIGPLASTMMACPPAVAKIEARYFGVSSADRPGASTATVSRSPRLAIPSPSSARPASDRPEA